MPTPAGIVPAYGQMLTLAAQSNVPFQSLTYVAGTLVDLTVLPIAGILLR